MWVRGLKLRCDILTSTHTVAPYVGAWIETDILAFLDRVKTVAPYVGAWIETLNSANLAFMSMSHPMWVRGLKLKLQILVMKVRGRTLCGCVD